ncbi:MAG: RNA-metabolising metallo-beta-lactamase [Parcubacteria group bacterium GW2011_GWA1_47_8]|nr:MAG: RNA-metabolising metallo-beta-lactamase [Parcubacteria group bacterium GW2011_GWA1_47_8]KKW06906.1 MAG: RNA-metabolising metallo-beta-lactamase [Parcubacteria group bacterium GW2011_GWA2_49_16]
MANNLQTAKLGFYGAAGGVTGSNHLLEAGGVRILIDCGLFQGVKICDDKNKNPFPYDPRAIDALFVTHAHLDHVGRIPKLINEGFRGIIYSTPPTRAIAALILEDSARVMGYEAKKDNHEPLYREEAVQRTLEQWKTTPYHHDIKLGELSIRLRDAGHILGSAMIEIVHGGKKIVFSGDLGNSPSLILPDTDALADVDYLVTEAVYGNKVHEDQKNRTELLQGVIEDTIKRKGVLMIPVFAIERTQDLLLELNDMVEKNRIPHVPVFVDSPLAIKVTRVFHDNASYFNDEVAAQIKGGDDIFKFARLRFTERTEDSIAIKDVPAPKIILAGSGMSNGGRILHHERNYLGDANNTLLLVGYQAVGTMGRALEEGAKTVNIMDQDIPVRAKIVTIGGYSAHKDVDALVEFVANVGDNLKKVFVVHAEPGAAMFFAQRVRDYLSRDVVIPREGEVVEIEF